MDFAMIVQKKVVKEIFLAIKSFLYNKTTYTFTWASACHRNVLAVNLELRLGQSWTKGKSKITCLTYYLCDAGVNDSVMNCKAF